MPCFHPIQAIKTHAKKPNGKSTMLFKSLDTSLGELIELPCGRCIGCRLERSRQWAIRCLHESELFKTNAFITLTYDDKHLPDDGSINVVHFQKFMKRLRKKIYPKKVRFFHCGEYGDQNGRPHYHACLFGYDFPDKILVNDTNGEFQYESALLNKLWGKGLCQTGDVSFASAAYVARYILKKVTGDLAEDHYNSIDTTTGVINIRKPEYITMSRRPGIGQAWYTKFGSDIYPHDYVIINGKKVRPPKYYDSLLEQNEPILLDSIKNIRKDTALLNTENNTDQRLSVRKELTERKLKQQKRNL